MGWLDNLIKDAGNIGTKLSQQMAAQPTYIEKLKAANPEAYKQLEGLMAYTANEGNAGVPQDWQAQIFTQLQTSAPKKIETGKYVDVPEYATDAENSPYQTGRTVKQWVQSAPEGYTPTVVEIGGDTTQYATTGYTKDLGKINGLPVMAQYDLEGNLTGYAADPAYRNWLSGSTGVSGQWDASGMPQPAQHVSRGGGFFGGLMQDLGPIAPLALSFALPGVGAALGTALGTSAAVGTALAGAGLQAAQGGSLEDITKGAALGAIGGQIGSGVSGLTDSAIAGQVAGGTSAGLLSGKDLETSLTGAALNTGSQQLAQSILTPTVTPNLPELSGDYSVNADYGLSAPSTSGLGLKANLAPLDMSNPYSFDTTLAATGGLGLNFNKAISAGNVGAMGGAQGLLGVGTNGKTLSEIGSAFQNNLTNTFTGQPLGQELQNLVTGAEMYSTDPNDLTETPNKALSNLLGKLLMATVSNTSGTGATQNPYASLFGSLLGGAGALYQGNTNAEANKTLADQLRQAGQTAQQQAQFKPIGITTRFGTSAFQVDPTTGQLTSASYTTSPELQAAQERLMGLGAGYLAKTPEQVAADYMARQQELLAPSRERQMAQLQNQLFQTGRGGLSVGATGTRPSGAAGLGATTPEMEAYYNALAQQDAALAAQAQQAGQQQVGFGAGLFGTAGELEKLAQQPLTLGTQLGGLSAQYGAGAGRLRLAGDVAAAEAMKPANQYNPLAQILSGVGTSPLVTSGLGSLFGNTELGKSLGNWLSGLGSTDPGLNTASIDYDYLRKIYANQNPYENVLGENETWAGE